MSSTLPALSALTPHVLGAIALVAMMAQLGLELEPVTDRAAKRHERWLVVRALSFNFLIVPLLALLAARLLHAEGPVAIALLLLAATPGGRHAPMLARTARADVSLAVEITLFANKLNALVSPLLAAWLLEEHRVDLRELPYIAELLLLQMLPYFGARSLRKRRPALAQQLARPTQWTATIATLLLLAWLLAHEALRITFVLGLRGWLAVLVFGAVLLVLGWIAGGREATERRAFALSAEARNLMLALVIGAMMRVGHLVLLSLFGAWTILFGLGWLAAIAARRRAPRRGGSAWRFRPTPAPAGRAP